MTKLSHLSKKYFKSYFTTTIRTNQRHRPPSHETTDNAPCCIGIKFDHEANKGVRGKEKKISAPDSKVAVYIVPTNEELVIARDTKAIVEKL